MQKTTGFYEVTQKHFGKQFVSNGLTKLLEALELPQSFHVSISQFQKATEWESRAPIWTQERMNPKLHFLKDDVITS